MRKVRRCATALAIAIASLGAAAEWAQAQEVAPHQQTAPPANARFQIVESELSAKWTLRLDRYTGHVAMLDMDADSSLDWTDTPVQGIPRNVPPTRPHFQIFTSGISARHTYLIDTDTGATWVLTTQSNPAVPFAWLSIGS